MTVSLKTMIDRILEGASIALQLLGWGVDGTRMLVDDRRERVRKAKAAKRSAQREADLLKRFERKEGV